MSTNLIQNYISKPQQPTVKPKPDFNIQQELNNRTFIKPLKGKGKLVSGNILYAPVDTFRDISKNPYVFKSSEDLSRNDARPGVTVCEMTDERLWYDIKKKSRFVPCDDGVGRKREEYYEKTPRSKSALKRKIVYNTLFPDVQKKYVKDRRFPIYPLISIVLCMAILIIPIYLSVLNNEINVENKEYDAYIRELREEIDVLNEELCKKNDMVLIDRIAREEYGMIDVELSNTHLMAPSSDEIVINELDSEEETNLWVSLLNALGVFFEK